MLTLVGLTCYINMIVSLSFKTGDLILFYFFVHESHLTDFPQAAA